MKHRIKRIFISLFARKQNSLLILFLMLILSCFMVVSYTTKLANNQILEKLKTNMEVSLNIKARMLDGYTGDDIEHLPADYDAKIHLENMLNVENTILNAISGFDGVSYESVYKLSLDVEVLHRNADIYAYNEDLLFSENYIIEKGRTFDDYDLKHNRNVALVNDAYEDVNVGDVVALADDEYEIIGTFASTGDRVVMTSGMHYPGYATLIVPQENLFALSLSSGVLIGASEPKVTVKGDLDSEEVKVKFANALRDNSDIVDDPEFEIVSNYEVSKSLSQPIENIGTIFDFITYSMIIVSALILFSFILFVARKRAMEFKVFFALGQSKLVTYGEFLLEIIIIANLAFIIALPLSIQITNRISQVMIKSNLQRQMRIAEMAAVDKTYEILKEQENVYASYNLDLKRDDFVILVILNNAIVVLTYPVLILTNGQKRKALS